jgi:hypothetical protein
MDVKSDQLAVYPVTRDEQGKQIDPEEAPAQRRLGTDFQVSTSNGQYLGLLDNGSGITVNGTAIEFAQGFAHQCALCRHFDNPAWLRLYHELEASHTPTHWNWLNNLRGHLLDVRDPQVNEAFHDVRENDLDVEAAMRALGICHAVSELIKDRVVTHPMAGCPLDQPGFGDLSYLFTPRDRDSERIGNSVYDTLLKEAQGKRRKWKGTVVFSTVLNRVKGIFGRATPEEFEEKTKS